MDFALSEAQAEIRRQVAALARGFGWDYWREKDRKAEYPIEFVRAFADAGWLGLAIPEAYGGAGLGVTEAVLMLEAICASGAGLSGASPVHFAVFPPMPIIRHGSEGLRRRILPEIAAGRLSLAFGVTEPNAGTDTSRIETMARRDGAGWVVKGRKVWTSNARHSEKMLLLARTTPYELAGPRKLDGLTLFVADLDPQTVEIREIEKLGRAAVDSNELIIDGLRVADEDVVGEVGRGFHHLLDSLNPERVLVAGEAVGIGRVALERAAAYARERVVFGRPIGQNQADRAPAGPRMGAPRGRLAADAPRRVALRPRRGVRGRGERGQGSRGGGRLRGGGCRAPDVRRLRVREGVRRRAPVAGGTALQDRAGLPADGAQLPGRAGPWPPQVLLTGERGGREPTGCPPGRLTD